MSDAGRPSKAQRQHRIGILLAEHAVTSQGRLVELLEAEGVVATQATVSRDLEEVGAVKVRVPGGETVYAIPELLADWVVEVRSSANLVILRTPPGSAHVVASALDRSGLPDVLGTVAGDDTMIVVVDALVGGDAVAGRLRGLAGLPPRPSQVRPAPRTHRKS